MPSKRLNPDELIYSINICYDREFNKYYQKGTSPEVLFQARYYLEYLPAISRYLKEHPKMIEGSSDTANMLRLSYALLSKANMEITRIRTLLASLPL